MPSLIRLIYHTSIITLAVIMAFIWLRSPFLSHYSIQLFGSVILVYFIIKKLNQADFWQLLPSPASLEMALATLAFLILIGATGNIKSPLFPLSFVHLFFLTLSAQNITTLIILFEIILFHFSLNSGITTIEISYLVSLPIVTGFFLLAKDQFIKVFKQKSSITQVVNITKTVEAIRELQRVDRVLENLLANLMLPHSMAPAKNSNANLAFETDSTTNQQFQLSQDSADESSLDDPAVDLDNLDAEISQPIQKQPSDQTLVTQNSPNIETISERLADEILDSVDQSKPQNA